MLYDESRSRPVPCSTTTAQPQLLIASRVSADDEGPAEQPREGDPERGAVHHEDGGLPRSEPVEDLAGGRHDPFGHLLDGLGPGRLDVGVRVPGERGVGTEALGELLAGQAGALAHVVLAQSWVLRGGQAGGLLQEGGGLAGAGEVAADEHGRVEVGQRGGQRLGLAASAVVEADVGVTLGAALRVPGRLAVPREDQSPARRGRLSDHGRR